MLAWEGSSAIHSLKSFLSYIKAGLHITTASLSFWENSAQTPTLKHIAALNLGYTSQDHTPESAIMEDLLLLAPWKHP